MHFDRNVLFFLHPLIITIDTQLFIYILLPNIWGFVIALFPVVLIAYIVILYSSFGRLVIYSRAMQPKEIFKREEENSMSTTRLFEELLTRAELEKKKQSPLPLFYRSKRELSEAKEQNRFMDNGFDSTHAVSYVGKISCSSGHHEDIPKDIIDDIIKSGDEEDNWGADKRIPQSLSDSEH